MTLRGGTELAHECNVAAGGRSALAQDPQFVVPDEPTASLVFGNQSKVMAGIRALAAPGHGALFTSHDHNHALHAADRALLLRDATQLAEGPVAQVLNRANLKDLCPAGRNARRRG